MPVVPAKFDLNRCNESPLRGEKPDFWPASKSNTGSFPLRGILPVIIAISVLLAATKCTKFVFGWGSAPDPAGGAHDASPDVLVGWGGGHPLPIPLAPHRRLRRLDFHARRSSRRLTSSVPPLLFSQFKHCLYACDNLRLKKQNRDIVSLIVHDRISTNQSVAQVATDTARTTEKTYWGKVQGRRNKTGEV